MKIKYLSFAQANAICTEYQSIKGKPANERTTISLVTVAPQSRILQWGFINDLLQGKPKSDLQRKYFNGRFDVIVVWMDPAEPNGFGIKDLRSYLAENGIRFDAQRYECLRTAEIRSEWARFSLIP
jgi:hypothetical protein